MKIALLPSNVTLQDSPAILIYPDLVNSNIALAVSIAGGAERLRPHAKTHKMAEVTSMLTDAGIYKFKCATIAEAEMLAASGAQHVLLAYQPTAVKASRLRALAAAYPSVVFGYLVDNEASATTIHKILDAPNLRCWIDVNVGMNRTGLRPGLVVGLFDFLKNSLGQQPEGLHAYDGHLHISDLNTRFGQAQVILEEVRSVRRFIEKEYDYALQVVMGGTPAFPYYAAQPDVDASPGTFVFWDAGYATMFPDMKFDIAALLITRVISVIDDNHICLDLGHK